MDLGQRRLDLEREASSAKLEINVNEAKVLWPTGHRSFLFPLTSRTFKASTNLSTLVAMFLPTVALTFALLSKIRQIHTLTTISTGGRFPSIFSLYYMTVREHAKWDSEYISRNRQSYSSNQELKICQETAFFLELFWKTRVPYCNK